MRFGRYENGLRNAFPFFSRFNIGSDKLYEILLENIIIYSDKFKQEAICKLINYPTILENEKLFNFALDYILKADTAYKANSIIEITKDETLVSNSNLNNLLNAK